MKHKNLIYAFIILIVIYFPLSLIIESRPALIFIAAGLALLLSSLANYFERKK